MPGTMLRENSNIIIVGGGPAGCFFALKVLRLMKERGLRFNIKILEQRDFSVAGPKGCNMCAGIIGGRVVDGITGLGVEIDSRVIRQDVEGFRIYLDGMNAEVKKRDSDRVFTVFRGLGPTSARTGEEFVGLDAFMLKKTIDMGVGFRKAVVRSIKLGRNINESHNVIYTDEGGNEIEEKADLVVIACGVNSALTRSFNFGYVPPSFWHTCQGEIDLPARNESLSRFIHIFSRRNSLFLFTAVTPKGRFMTITGIGKWVKFQDLLDELTVLQIKKLFNTDLKISCHCHPRIPVTTARNPYYHRLVMVGDACVSRYLKNGIESALFTSQWAAESAIVHGIDRDSFHRNYRPQFHSFLTRDNRYGRVMFFLYRVTSSNKFFSRICISVLKLESQDPKKKYWMMDILWHLFAGDKPYRKIFGKTFMIWKALRMIKNAWR